MYCSFSFIIIFEYWEVRARTHVSCPQLLTITRREEPTHLNLQI